MLVHVCRYQVLQTAHMELSKAIDSLISDLFKDRLLLCARMRRYQELQTAHMELGRAMADPSTNANKLVKYRAAVRTQEEVGCDCVAVGTSGRGGWHECVVHMVRMVRVRRVAVRMQEEVGCCCGYLRTWWCGCMVHMVYFLKLFRYNGRLSGRRKRWGTFDVWTGV